MNPVGALVVLQSEAPEATIFEAVANIVGDPVSVVTLLVGTVVLAASLGYFAYLTVGALVDAAVGDAMESPGRTPPPRQ